MMWALMGRQLCQGHEAEKHTPLCSEAPLLCPCPISWGSPLLPGVAGKLSTPSG